jgi:transposase-like protein
MQPISYARHQFLPEVIRHAVWLYLRFTVLKFGPAFARNLRRLRPRPSTQWHLDEMAVVIRSRPPQRGL